MYSDGKVKRTLKRRSKVLETVKRETDGASKIKKNINKKPKNGQYRSSTLYKNKLHKLVKQKVKKK